MIYVILLDVIWLASLIYVVKVFYKKKPKDEVPRANEIAKLKNDVSSLETALLEYALLLDKFTLRLEQDESAWLLKQEPDKGPIEFSYVGDVKGESIPEIILDSFAEALQGIKDREAVAVAAPPKTEPSQKASTKSKKELTPEQKRAWAEMMTDARRAKKEIAAIGGLKSEVGNA